MCQVGAFCLDGALIGVACAAVVPIATIVLPWRPVEPVATTAIIVLPWCAADVRRSTRPSLTEWCCRLAGRRMHAATIESTCMTHAHSVECAFQSDCLLAHLASNTLDPPPLLCFGTMYHAARHTQQCNVA